jgi:hypothetical protein
MLDYNSRPEVREQALRVELATLENSPDREAKDRRIDEVRAALAEFEAAEDPAPAPKRGRAAKAEE